MIIAIIVIIVIIMTIIARKSRIVVHNDGNTIVANSNDESNLT